LEAASFSLHSWTHCICSIDLHTDLSSPTAVFHSFKGHLKYKCTWYRLLEKSARTASFGSLRGFVQSVDVCFLKLCGVILQVYIYSGRRRHWKHYARLIRPAS